MSDSKQLTGNESLKNFSAEVTAPTVHNFWQWAFSDIKMNDTRGVFAEWLVAKILEIPLTVRVSWDERDFITTEGVTIEVKSSAYLQSWDQKNKLSKIIFSGLNAKKMNASSNKYAESSTFNSDLYVFCVQTEKNADRWDALDLKQWDFYLLQRVDLEKLGQKSLSLKPLSVLCPKLDAEELRIKAKTVIKEIHIHRVQASP